MGPDVLLQSELPNSTSNNVPLVIKLMYGAAKENAATEPVLGCEAEGWAHGHLPDSTQMWPLPFHLSWRCMMKQEA